MSHEPRDPSASPLGSMGGNLALTPDKYGKRFRPVVAAIDRLHRVGQSTAIPVIVTNTRDCTGCYKKHAGTGEPICIEVSKRNDGMELTLAHEIGHFLEGALLPGSAFGARNWPSDNLTRGWRESVKSTESYRLLGRIAATGEVSRLDPERGGIVGESLPGYVGYLMTEQELWARSYAQWVAVRGRTEPLIEQIQRSCFPRLAYPLQWKDGEFAPVAKALDALFEGIGWRK